MKSSSFIFILCVTGSVISYSISNTDKCSGRWQFVDKSDTKITLDWRILPKTNIIVTEFRTNSITKGSWYAFGLASSPDKSLHTVDGVYALRWGENDTKIFWDTYNVTQSTVVILQENNSSVVTFQRLSSSGLLTVRPTIDLNSYINGKRCLYFVYMRGRFEGDQPLVPDEIRSNQSLCLTCQRFELTSTFTHDVTTHLPKVYDFTTEKLRLLDSTSSLLSNNRKECKFIWFGRIINRSWSNDYLNLRSLSSQNLRLDLQNLFLFLINHNSSYSFICNQFELYSLQSGSILFANYITLLTNLSDDQTINTIEKLVTNSINYSLNFDQSAHYIKRINEISQIDILFKNLSRTVDNDVLKGVDVDSALHLIVGCIIGIGCLMLLITSILCLYGYYKCRRRQFRLFTERQTLKFKHDINSYTWLGQQPSISSSSPYLIQSTSI